MDSEKFIRMCKFHVVKYFNDRLCASDEDSRISVKDVYLVWLSKVLQNSKALLSTTVPDGMYYEITYNGDKHELYLDAYKKWENVVIPVVFKEDSDV